MKNNKFLIVYIFIYTLSIIINFNTLSPQYFCTLNTTFLIYLILVKILGEKNKKLLNLIFITLVSLSLINFCRYIILLIIMSDYDFIYSNLIMSIIHFGIYSVVLISYLVKCDLHKTFYYDMAIILIIFVINSVCSILNIVEFNIINDLISIILDFMVGNYMIDALKRKS